MVTGSINYNYSIANQGYASKNVKLQAANSSEGSQDSAAVSSPQAQSLPRVPQGVAFAGVFSSSSINNLEQNQKYTEIQSVADNQTKRRLENLLKTGRLLNSNSNDGSTTLDNLHKIATTPRHPGLDNQVMLREVVKEIENPFVITQKFGDIPQGIAPQIVEYEQQLQGSKDSPQGLTLNSADYNVEYSSTCPAASMQFNIADKKPAEYARIAADLTSPEGQFVKRVKYNNIAQTLPETLELLKDFNVTIKQPPNNWEDIDIIVKPDANAIVRAQVQNSYQDPGERSSISSLMQSAFMNLASENAYNSLTDKRYGKFSVNNEGLTEFEKNFLESIMDDEPKISVVYQNVDDNKKLQGYAFDFKETEGHLLQALNSGTNVIIGITEVDPQTKEILGGHEITVIGAKRDRHGDLSFICNDTDDNYTGAIFMKSQDLIPKIHHAGIPAKLIELPKEKSVGYQILDDYNKSKKSA